MTNMTPTPKTVGERIAWARKRKGVSQERLAERVGTTRRHIIRLEQNENKPREPLRAALAASLGQKPEFFESDEDEESSGQPSMAQMLNDLIDRIHRDTIDAVRAEIGREQRQEVA